MTWLREPLHDPSVERIAEGCTVGYRETRVAIGEVMAVRTGATTGHRFALVRWGCDGWCWRGEQCEGWHAQAYDLGALVVLADADLWRACQWPSCRAGYDVTAGNDIGPGEPGWMRVQGRFWSGLLICPEHADWARQHRPTAEDGPGGPDTSVVTCACGTVSPVLGPPGNFYPAYRWWSRHVRPTKRVDGSTSAGVR